MLNQFGVAADDHQHIVKIMSNAAGQPPNGLHLLGLGELLFESLAFGHVLSETQKRLDSAAVVPYRYRGIAYGDGAAIFAFPLDLVLLDVPGLEHLGYESRSLLRDAVQVTMPCAMKATRSSEL